jgi:fatty-acyl-CoA synthase
MDLSDLIDRNAAFTPDKVAIRFQGRTLNYADFAGRIAAAARALKSRLGVGRGDRVAILAANHPDYLVLLYACARLGAMLVPLNWRLAVRSSCSSFRCRREGAGGRGGFAAWFRR